MSEQRGKWRVDWYVRGRNNAVRQEWFCTYRKAKERLEQLNRWRKGAAIFHNPRGNYERGKQADG